MKNYLEKYISENIKIIKILVVSIIIGFILGMILVHFFSNELRGEFTNTIKETLDVAKSGNYENINIIKNGIMSNTLVIALIYLAAITLIAPICITFINFLKGLTVGMYVSSLFCVFGFGKGILANFLIVILPNIIYFPAFIYISTNAIKFYYEITESKNKLSLIIKETYKLIISISLIILAVLIEQLSSFGVINLYIK